MTEPAPKVSSLANVGRGARVEVAAEVAALATAIVSQGSVDPVTLDAMLVELGLVVRVPYDPAQHLGHFGDEVLPGDPLLVFSADLKEAFEVGRPHLLPMKARFN